MASQGPRFPGTAATLANAGTSENAEAWVNPGNITADDGTQSTITAATYDSPDISQLLVASNFGFTIPYGARIDGIVVEVDRSNAAGAASDNRVQLAKGTAFANLVGNNKADTATDWPTAQATVSYGASTDLWGASWSVEDINAASFAVFLSAQADAANTDVGVDFIRVTVSYSELLGTAIRSNGFPPGRRMPRQTVVETAGVVEATPPVVPAGLTHSRDIGDLRVSPQVLVSGLTHSRDQGSIRIDPKLFVEGLTHSRDIGSATVTNKLYAAGLEHTRAIGSITISPKLFVTGLTHSRAIGTASIVALIQVAGLTHSRSLGDLTVSSKLFLTGLTHTRAQGSVTVSPKVFVTGLTHSRALGALSLGISLVGLEHTRAQGSLTVSPKFFLSGLTHTRAFGDVTVSTAGGGGTTPLRTLLHVGE